MGTAPFYIQEKYKKLGQNYANFTWSSFLQGFFAPGYFLTEVWHCPRLEMFGGGNFPEVGKVRVKNVWGGKSPIKKAFG